MKAVDERFGDVVRLRMISVAGQLVGVGVSVYVIRGVMIDTGFDRARAAVVDAVSRLQVHGVIVTHWHEDHAGNAAALARIGVPVFMRDDTAAILWQRPDIHLYRKFVWGRPPALDVEPRPVIAHGLECHHTPGHSHDHQVVWDRETGTLFSGDLWLGVRSRILHSSEDPYVIVESLRHAAALGPERMFDAHRGPVKKPVAALTSKAEWMTETLGEIERRVGEGASDRAIVKEVLGGEQLAALLSHGEYARRNFVRAVRRHRGQ